MKERDDLGFSKMPLCREPWESFYILRRGILPCCYGNPIIGAMPEYAEAWNSAKLQEIRSYLSRGELSPYCRESLGCPIVQRVLRKEEEAGASVARRRPAALRFVNKMLFGLPGKIWRFLRLGL
ncbi:MAG: SPASM domain-containing protein [Candidatus Aminicenantales bacterium]